MSKKVLMVGWPPTAVNNAKWPGLTPEKLEAALRADEAKLNGLGFEPTLAFIHSSDTAADDLTSALEHASKTITGQHYVRPNLEFMRSAMKIATEELERRLQGIQPTAADDAR